MTSLALSLLLQITLSAAVSADSASAAASSTAAAGGATVSSPAPNSYAAAFKDTQDTGKPLVVLIGASWCPACRSMKTSIMPAVSAQGGLANVAFAYVNTDAQSELAGRLMEGGLIPQLVMYEKAGDGWKLTRLVGAQSVETVQGFIGPAAAQYVAAKQGTAQKQAVVQKQPAPQTPTTQSSSAAKQPTASQRLAQQHSAAG